MLRCSGTNQLATCTTWMGRGATKIVDQSDARLAESTRKLDEEKLNELARNDADQPHHKHNV